MAILVGGFFLDVQVVVFYVNVLFVFLFFLLLSVSLFYCDLYIKKGNTGILKLVHHLAHFCQQKYVIKKRKYCDDKFDVCVLINFHINCLLLFLPHITPPA